MANNKESTEDTTIAKPKDIQRTFSITMPDGSIKRIKARGKTVEEAEANLRDLKWQYKQGLLTFNGNTTFERWYKQWLETYKKTKLSSKSYYDTTLRINKYFIPVLGSLKMSEIRSTHIQMCINELDGMSKSHISKCRTDIQSIFSKAILNEIIVKNPTLSVEVPKGTEGERRSLTEEEKKVFMTTIDKHPKGDLFAMTLACGLRPGEARCLTWFNVKLDKGIINITSAIKADTMDIEGPKSKAGIRTIPIPDWYIKRLKKIPLSDNTSFIFPNKSGTPLTEQNYTRSWHSFLRLMDIEAGAVVKQNKVIMHSIDQKLTAYYLRHTFATDAVEKGVPIKTLQYLMGHEEITTTAKYYTHITDKMIESARDIINAKPEKKSKTNRIGKK